MLLFGTGFKGLDPQIYKRKRVPAFIIDETLIQTGKQYFWLWIYLLNQFTVQCLEHRFKGKKYLLISEKLIRSLVCNHGKHIVYTEMEANGMMKLVMS